MPYCLLGMTSMMRMTQQRRDKAKTIKSDGERNDHSWRKINNEMMFCVRR
jgi:hypothetical protein